jgi:predicted nucleic acid-binding protein
LNRDLVFIDTSGWICFFARRGFPEIKRAISALLDEDRVATSGPVLLELLQGCRSEAERQELEGCLEGVRWLPVENDHWRQAGRLAFDLRRKGITVTAMDALIATVALAHGCALFHRDRDYDRIAGETGLRSYSD